MTTANNAVTRRIRVVASRVLYEDRTDRVQSKHGLRNEIEGGGQRGRKKAGLSHINIAGKCQAENAERSG